MDSRTLSRWGALTLTCVITAGCKHAPVETGRDVLINCIKSESGLHLKQGESRFQFGRYWAWPFSKFTLKNVQHVDFPWEQMTPMDRLECGATYTWDEVQANASTYKCTPATAVAQERAATMSAAAASENLQDQLIDPCTSTCATDPHSRVQGYVALHGSVRNPTPAIRHCVQMYDIAAGGTAKAGILLKVYHESGGNAHGGFAHGVEQ